MAAGAGGVESGHLNYPLCRDPGNLSGLIWQIPLYQCLDLIEAKAPFCHEFLVIEVLVDNHI
jgi:hypothetical protein